MAINLNGSDFQGGGNFIQVDPGTYPVTLKAAKMYLNNEFESDQTMVQIGLVWDTGLVGENDDGQEVDVVIFDDWIRFSLNEKANFTKRLAAIFGNDFAPETAKITLELEGGIDDLEALPHWREARTPVTKFEVNGESIFGRQALITVGHNKKGYLKVQNISAPPAAPQGGKLKTRAAPAGAPA